MKATLDVLNDMVTTGVIGTYAIAGAIAAYTYVEATATDDLDILVSFDAAGNPPTGLILLEPVFSYLTKRGYSKFVREGVLIEGWPVQFLPVASDLDAEALAEAVDLDLAIGPGAQTVRTRILRAEHLIAIALRVGRPKDQIRISQFIEENAFNSNDLKEILTRHGLLGKWNNFRSRFKL